MPDIQTIADRMRASAAAMPFGCVNATMFRGLEVTLSHIDERWRLAMRRRATFPTDGEVEIVRRAFRVAEGSEPSYREEHRRTLITETPITLYAVEFSWMEI